MQLLLQASPLIDKLKHWQRAISFNEIHLTTSQKVVLWSLGVVGTSAVVVGVLSRYLARRRAKPIINPRIQRAINKRISRMRSPNGGMGSIASGSGGRSSPLGFSERLSLASGSIGSGGGDAAPLSPQQLGVMGIANMAPPRRILRQQLEILMDFLEENKEMSKGLSSSAPVSQQATRQKWAAVAKKLNSVESGALKTPEGWKKYWFEWRHKCRRKASDARRFQSTSHGSTSRFVPLNDLEVRVIDLNGSGTVTPTTSSSKQLENFLAEDSDSEPLENIKARTVPIGSNIKSATSSSRGLATDDEYQTMTPPPKWALDFEERRIAAEERMAEALESIASVMRSQEDRRAALDDRIANAVTAMAGTVQDLNSGIHEALQHLRHQQPMQNGMEPKDEIYY